MFRNVAEPPVIEMRIVTERKIVERLLFFLDISNLIINSKYTKFYTACLQNIKTKLIFIAFFMWAIDLILFY